MLADKPSASFSIWGRLSGFIEHHHRTRWPFNMTSDSTYILLASTLLFRMEQSLDAVFEARDQIKLMGVPLEYLELKPMSTADSIRHSWRMAEQDEISDRAMWLEYYRDAEREEALQAFIRALDYEI